MTDKDDFTVENRFWNILTGNLDPFWLSVHYRNEALPENTTLALAALLALAED
jgi:hypothetical protein